MQDFIRASIKHLLWYDLKCDAWHKISRQTVFLAKSCIYGCMQYARDAYIHTYKHTHAQRNTSYMYSVPCRHVYVCLYIYIYIYIYLHTYTYIHTYTHTCKYTKMLAPIDVGSNTKFMTKNTCQTDEDGSGKASEGKDSRDRGCYPGKHVCMYVWMHAHTHKANEYTGTHTDILGWLH